MLKIGIDIGGTFVKAGVCKGARVLWRDIKPSLREEGQMAELVTELVQKARAIAPGAPVGVCCPGSLSDTGRVTASQLGWDDYPLAAALRPSIGSFALYNDGLAALLFERRFGALKGVKNGALVTLGTGIGGGVLLDGRIVKGRAGYAPELGHMITHGDGLHCPCGQRGCWEEYASAKALKKRAGCELKELAAKLSSKIDEGVWQAYLWELCLGLQSLCSLFSPEVIALGGGLSDAIDNLAADAEALLNKTRWKPCPPTRVVKAKSGNDAGVLGAAMGASG